MRNSEDIITTPKKNNNKHFVKVSTYESWSTHNMKLHIDLSIENEKGVIYYLSDTEISEVEIYGICKLVEEKSEIYKGIDLEYYVYKAQYNENVDMLNCKTYNMLCTYNASGYTADKSIFESKPFIVAVEYTVNKRYEKGLLWKVLNPRRCSGVILLRDEF